MPEPYIIRRAGDRLGWEYHIARREEGQPCVQVHKRRTRCTVILDLSTTRRILKPTGPEDDPVRVVSQAAIKAGADSVMWGGHSVTVLNLPLDRAEEVARALVALGNDPEATQVDTAPDYSRWECWGG